MKRVLLAVAAILIIPGMVLAASSTLGVYVDGKLYYTPPTAPYEFTAYLVIVEDEYQITGVQYALSLTNPSQLVLLNVEYPFEYSVGIGDPINGHAITFSPPVSTYPYGYRWLVKYTFLVVVPCPDMWDYHVDVVGHPDPGLEHPVYGGLWGTYAPDHEAFDIDGLSLVICPFETDAKDESWGAIKSMYK